MRHHAQLHHARLHHRAAPHPNRALERYLLEPNRPLHEGLGFARHALGTIEHLALLAGALALVVTVGVLLLRAVQRNLLPRGARLVRIGVPPDVQDTGGHLLWSALHDLLRPRLARVLIGQPHLSWEIAASETGTIFRLWVPKVIPPGLIERAVSAAWPGASANTEPVPADEPDTGYPPRGMVRLTSELALSGPGWFSLDASLNPDPLPLILGQLSGLTDSERALIQVIARPATSREQHRLRNAARRIRKGEPTSRVLRLMQALRTQPPTPPRLDPTITPDVREAMSKSAGSLYRCIIRVTVTADSRKEARGRIHAVLGAFAPYNGTRVFLRRRHAPRALLRLRQRRLGRRAFLLGVDELAALAHLPGQDAIPGVVMAGAREIAPPPGLPAEGKPLGRGSNGRQINLAIADARQHIHVLGPTGVGKSTLIARLVLADFDAGRGAVVIDPKGDLIEDILTRIPAGRENDVDLLDPRGYVPACVVLGSLVWVASASATGVNIGYYSQQNTPSRAEAGSSITVTSSKPGRESYAGQAPVGGGGEEGGRGAGSSASSGPPNSESGCVAAGEVNVSPCYGVVPAPAPARPGRAAPGPPPVNPAAMAVSAATQLDLSVGGIIVSPSARTMGLTGAAFWFWLEPAPASRSVSVSLRGERVTVSASAASVRWSFGDESSLVAGPGVPYRPGTPPGGAVRHVYRTRCLPGDQGHDPNVLSSCGPNGYRVEALVQWAISYTASGPVAGGGPLPARSTEASISYPVSESRAFLTAEGER